MERLSHLITHVLPIYLSRRCPPLSHLFFYDDILWFAKTSVEHITLIKQYLDNFGAVSGQKVNYSKSQVLSSSNVEPWLQQSICEIAGMFVTNDIGKYLGVSIVHVRPHKHLFAPLF